MVLSPLSWNKTNVKFVYWDNEKNIQCWIPCALGGGKVSMLIYTHTNPWGRLKWAYAIIRQTAHFMCGLMSDLVICKFRKSMVIHDIECSYWDQVSLNNTNPKPFWIYTWEGIWFIVLHVLVCYVHWLWDLSIPLLFQGVCSRWWPLGLWIILYV